MKSKKVLIVEDNDLNRKLFENLIGQFFNFKSAGNGLQAIDYLAKEHFDLILMDIQMPKMDGISALKKIQHGELTESPVIAVTAFAEESDRASFLKMGFTDFITKPIRPKEFLETIETHLRQQGIPLPESSIEELQPLLLDREVISQLMKYNSQESINAVINDFIQDSSTLLHKAEIALTQKNETELIENLHILKGNSGTLGANSIYILAKGAEDYCRSNDWAQVKGKIEELKAEKSIFEKFLEDFIFEL